MSGPVYAVYAADPEGAVTAVPLDGLVALFHAPSGQTHIVAPPAPEILSALGEGPADAPALLARLRARYDIEGGPEAIASRLAELELVGLVHRR
ncbi:MAG: HPr-rel-A system PqqD family peptide chaperone [Allosphingosinicella sp.]|uniref:HPr-rel-A system PqqD family peptide chaperone n=1 Tax=Allosphingosinicella sp. TaxID=2823234 RepID=UPI0039223975